LFKLGPGLGVRFERLRFRDPALGLRLRFRDPALGLRLRFRDPALGLRLRFRDPALGLRLRLRDPVVLRLRRVRVTGAGLGVRTV
jgi:hypothetical protein